MSDSRDTGHEAAGSSKLQLPTTQRRGSSVALSDHHADGRLPIADQPTAISKEPPLDKQANSLAQLVRSLVGQNLMHFHIDEFVGGGGMGAVFRGHDLSLGRMVAIKVLSRATVDEETIRRFRHEAQSAAKLNHPSIPHVYFVGEHDGWHFIAFEFIEGTNIRDLVLQNGPLEIPEAITYLADITEALQHASSRDVIHRDVKPSNVLVTPGGRAKLVDMGLARSGHTQSTGADLTATGVTLGTFDYISPEQARDPRNADTRSDIYSLGCTLYFMLTGQPPFPEGTMLQKLLSHSSDLPSDPGEFRDDVPDRLVEILARMLAKKPEHRQQDASELLGDVLFFAEEEQIPLNSRHDGVVIERKVYRESGLSRHIPWIVPLFVLVSTAIGLQIWQVEPTPPPVLPRSDPDAVLPAQEDASLEGRMDVEPRLNRQPADVAESAETDALLDDS